MALIPLDLDGLLENGSSLPDPIIYQYYNKLNERKIVINEGIGSGIVETVIIPLLEMDNDGTGKPIEIILKKEELIWI